MRKSKKIAWICLVIAGLLELVWAYFMKASHGFTLWLPSFLAVFFIAVSFFLLERAIRVFGIGMSYAVFTGIGIAGTTLLGIFFLREGINWMKALSLAILVIGIVGLKFCGDDKIAEKNTEDVTS